MEKIKIKKPDFSNAKVGDKVIEIGLGHGVIFEINADHIQVEFPGRITEIFSMDGCLRRDRFMPVLWPADEFPFELEEEPELMTFMEALCMVAKDESKVVKKKTTETFKNCHWKFNSDGFLVCCSPEQGEFDPGFNSIHIEEFSYKDYYVADAPTVESQPDNQYSNRMEATVHRGDIGEAFELNLYRSDDARGHNIAEELPMHTNIRATFEWNEEGDRR